MSEKTDINDHLLLQLREDLLDSLDEEFELEMQDRLGEDAPASTWVANLQGRAEVQ